MRTVRVVPGSFRLTGEQFFAGGSRERICTADVAILIDGTERMARVYIKEASWEIADILQVTKNAAAKSGSSVRPFQFKNGIGPAIRVAVREALRESRKECVNG